MREKSKTNQVIRLLNFLLKKILPGFMLICFCLISHTVNSQDLQVTGQVTDQADIPLPGVSIVIAGTTIGTVTDVDGRFSLAVPSGSTLEFSFVGMQTKEIVIIDQTELNVTLIEELTALDEIVVIGYGTQSRKTLSTAISSYRPEDLEQIPINTIGDGLKGKMSGVRVYHRSGQPGEEPIIRVRGGSSIQKSNNPLVLVDGFERSMADINPRDVESIEVLKDASAISIYGARGSNGVILVTTKTGRYDMEPRITFETDFSHQNHERNYDVVGTEEYITLSRLAIARSPNPHWLTEPNRPASTGNDETSRIGLRVLDPGDTPPPGWKTMQDPLDPSTTLTYSDIDWPDRMVNPALRQNYYLGATGGSENIRYQGGIGFSDDQGIVYATGWQRITARANADVLVTDRLTFTTGVDFSETHPEEHPNHRAGISRQIFAPGTQRDYYEDGTPAEGQNASSGAPLWYEWVHQREQVNRMLNLTAALNYDITDNFNASVTGGHHIINSQFDGFQRANVFNQTRPASSTFSEGTINQVEGLLNYDFNIQDNHNFTVLLGSSYRSDDRKSLSASARGAISDKVLTLNVAPEKTQATTSLSEDILISFFGRVMYDYDMKYIFSASLRQDGSSRFGAENKWGYFPSFSAAWNVSDEDFMMNSQTISNFKLRASIGLTGNNAVGRYTAQGAYSLGYRYDNQPGARNTTMPNQALTWESTTQRNVGFDLGLFDNRVTILADLYDKITDNLLFSVPLPNTSGFGSIETNVGSVKFYGYDLEFKSTIIERNNFSWNASFTISGNKNEVLSLPENDRDRNRIGGWVVPDGEDFGGIAEGEPLYRIYGYKVDFIIDNAEEAANARWDHWSTGWDPVTQTRESGRKKPGDYEWKDRTGDGRITEYDQFELGRSVPHTTGGIGNSFSYGNFNLRVFMDYGLGHSIMDWKYMKRMHSGLVDTWHVDVRDAWKEPGDYASGKAKTSILEFHSTHEGSNYRRPSDAGLFNSDFLCIREVSLVYKVPRSYIQRIGLQDLNVFMSGHNLHYFTEVEGLPPDGLGNVFLGGGDLSATGYPPVRRVTLGVKVTL